MNIFTNGKKEDMDLSKLIIILETNPPSPLFKNRPAHALWFINILLKFNKNLKIKSYNVALGEFPKKLSDINGVIITGSSLEVYEKKEWIYKTEEFIKKFKQLKIPVLGVCFGCQLIAQAFGGKVVKNIKGREIGTCKILLSNNSAKDRLLSGLPLEIYVQESHISAVEKLPKKAIVLAENDYGIQAFKLLNENIWGVQFHPEVIPKNLKKVIKFRQKLLVEEGLNAHKIYDTVQPTQDAQQILKNFLNIIYANS